MMGGMVALKESRKEGEAKAGQGAQVGSRSEPCHGLQPFLGGPKVQPHRGLVAVNQALASWTCRGPGGGEFKWGQQKEYGP